MAETALLQSPTSVDTSLDEWKEKLTSSASCLVDGTLFATNANQLIRVIKLKHEKHIWDDIEITLLVLIVASMIMQVICIVVLVCDNKTHVESLADLEALERKWTRKMYLVIKIVIIFLNAFLTGLFFAFI